MNSSFTTVDFAVAACSLAIVAGLGIWAGLGNWAGSRQPTSDDFFFAGRRLGWGPLGVSLGTAGLTAVLCCGGPNEAYFEGMKLLLVPILFWATLPILFWCILPLYGTLDLESVYEYLELRFDPTTRAVAGAIYFVWQLLWLAGLLVLPCKILFPGEGLSLSILGLLVVVGLLTTAYTLLGGIRATVWAGVGQFGLMMTALVLLIVAIGANLDDGLPRVLQLAGKLGRTTLVDTTVDWSARWSALAGVPFCVLVPMFFFVADQTTLQRLFTARDAGEMRPAWLLGGALSCIVVALSTYAGMGLLAVYHDKAQSEIPPHWVVNSATDPDSGRRLIGPATVIDADTIGGLVESGLILDPNTNRPLTDTQGLLRDDGSVNIDRLATRATRKQGGERRLRAGRDELSARFIRRHLPLGAAGLVAAGLLAAAMAVIASGINSLATVVVVDFHRRFGWAERWLAERCGKSPDELDQIDELRLGRPLVLVLGIAVILVGVVVAEVASPLGFLLGLLGLFAGPLLALFLLGLFTRRTTGPAALAGLFGGMAVALWATLGHATVLRPLWPFSVPLGALWPLTFGFAATCLLGYLFSFLIGSRKSRNELSGLVAGIGHWGVLLETDDETEEVYWIETDDEPPEGPRS
ncbi:MAG: hypothetical protein V3R99_04855 [Thermoguttaceae bacterium]